MNLGRPRLKRLALAGALLLPFPLSWLAWPHILEGRLPVCLFRLITGQPCPFCGLTRAFACAMHGEYTRANQFNAGWWLAAALLLLLSGISLFDFVTGSRYWRFVEWVWKRTSLNAVLVIALILWLYSFL